MNPLDPRQVPRSMTQQEAVVVFHEWASLNPVGRELVSIDALADVLGISTKDIERMLRAMRGSEIPVGKISQKKVGLRARLMGLPDGHDPISSEDIELWLIAKRIKALSPKAWARVTEFSYRAGNIELTLEVLETGRGRMTLLFQDHQIVGEHGNAFHILFSVYRRIDSSSYHCRLRKMSDKLRVEAQTLKQREETLTRLEELRRFRSRL